MTTITITKDVAAKVLEAVDAGLVRGVGVQKPGEMCVEAAVCYALGLPHGDDPGCVLPALRTLKIRLNDSRWSSNEARAKGLRRLAVAQLGSKDVLDDREFSRRVSEMTIRTVVPIALRAATKVHKNAAHAKALEDAATDCELAGTEAAARRARTVAYAADAADAAADAAAYAAAYAAYAAAAYAADAADAAADAAAYAAAYAADAAAARDKILSDFAERVVSILIDMKAPGCEWLPLTEAAP